MADTQALAGADNRPGRGYDLWMRELRATMVLGWPLALSTLAQMAVMITDVIFIGRLGAQALAAATLATNLYHLVMLFSLGLLMAAPPMIARELGRNRFAVGEVRRTVRQGLWSAIIVFIPCAVLLWNGERLLLLIGEPADLSAMAGGYLRAFLWGLLPFLGFIVLRSFVAALERPQWALVAAVASIIFNIIGNWLLVFGNLGFPRLEVVGSGIASACANLLLFVVLLIVVLRDRRFRRYQVFGRFWQADWPRFTAFWRLGLPIALVSTLEVSVFNAAAFMMGWIGEASLAAHAVAIQLVGVAFMAVVGLSQAVTVRVGRAFGAGDADGVMRAGWVGFGVGMVIMVISGLTMTLIPETLAGIFLDTSDPANARAVQLAVTFLALAAIFQLADGAQVLGIAALRGLHDTRMPMIYGIIGYWLVGLPLSVYLAFGAGLGGAGIWTGLTVGLCVVAVLMMARWMRRVQLGLLQGTKAPPA
ncbi:MATE family efflux transporter [Pseudochelatococcus contaminans]|uniref:Multidrug-efflux transporter n=1 Tax=Pseudochelatococcus contaminans TaxID=1538103 RepID=A0A7W5Z3I8_9HYPH|nr:MATE family efflux transporter [Pseudochelatococcus contaminans]MBB3808936.1 MATE family multidrug resistance protein [Pseudochelatococcus contaminans]